MGDRKTEPSSGILSQARQRLRKSSRGCQSGPESLGVAAKVTESSQRLKLVDHAQQQHGPLLRKLIPSFFSVSRVPVASPSSSVPTPLSHNPTPFAKKHPTALVRPVTTIQSQRMSSTPVAGVPYAPAKLEKKPVKFSNLLREF